MCGVDAAGRATYGLPVRFRPASLASERLLPVVRGSLDAAINVTGILSEERRTSETY
jgi:hypothetical protein